MSRSLWDFIHPRPKNKYGVLLEHSSDSAVHHTMCPCSTVIHWDGGNELTRAWACLASALGIACVSTCLRGQCHNRCKVILSRTLFCHGICCTDIQTKKNKNITAALIICFHLFHGLVSVWAGSEYCGIWLYLMADEDSKKHTRDRLEQMQWSPGRLYFPCRSLYK